MANHKHRKTDLPNYNASDIGKRLKMLRIQNNRTLTDVADGLEFSRTTISWYESNPSNMDIHSLFEFADYYNVSVSFILFGKDDSDKQTISLSHDTFIAWMDELLKKYF